jgi:hypothetical protein
MDSLVYAIRHAVDVVLTPMDALPPWLAIVLFSIISGVALIWAFGKISSPKRLEVARDRMSSAIYEVRLYFDSPKRIISSQFNLLRWSFLYILYTVPALLILGLPLSVLFVPLEARYGLEPLHKDATALVHVVLDDKTEPDSVKLAEAQSTVKLSAPPVVIRPTHEMYFRVNAPEGTGQIALQAGGQVVTKEITAGTTTTVNAERASGLEGLLAIGGERPLPPMSGVTRISVRHETRDMSLLGLSAPWWVHWLVISTIAALLVKKRMGVVF